MGQEISLSLFGTTEIHLGDRYEDVLKHTGHCGSLQGISVTVGLLKLTVILLAQVNQGQVQAPATPAPSQSQAQVTSQPQSQPQPPDPNQVTPAAVPVSLVPKIVLDKTTYDFGNVIPNSSRTAVFTLTNAGYGTLQITDVKKCCGAIVKLDKQKLDPGESGTLTAEYCAGQGTGSLTKRIGLITNDPKAPQVELTITGKVVQTLTWTPTRFDLSIRSGKAPCPDITIKGLDGTPFSIKGFAATGQSLTADLDPTAKATEFVLKPKVDAAKLEALTTSTGTIRIELDRSDYPAIELGFAVIPSLQVIPSQIFVFSTKADEPVVRTLQVKDNQSDPNVEPGIQIESVMANRACLGYYPSLRQPRACLCSWCIRGGWSPRRHPGRPGLPRCQG